jgi:hypothetical protein
VIRSRRHFSVSFAVLLSGRCVHAFTVDRLVANWPLLTAHGVPLCMHDVDTDTYDGRVQPIFLGGPGTVTLSAAVTAALKSVKGITLVGCVLHACMLDDCHSATCISGDEFEYVHVL